MAAVVVVLCCCSMMLSSSAGGAFFAGVIPGTAPHFSKLRGLKEHREYIDMANELRLLSAEIPTEAELSDTEDLSLKNKLTQTFIKIQELSQKFCELHNSLKESAPARNQALSEHYDFGDAILTLSGMKDWGGYERDYLKPTEERKAKLEGKTCEGEPCVPFENVEKAWGANDEACTNLKDMLEQSPEEIAEQIINEIQSRTSST